MRCLFTPELPFYNYALLVEFILFATPSPDTNYENSSFLFGV